MNRNVLLFLIAFVTGAHAQDTCGYSLTGRVIDEHDGQPLSFGEVFIEGTGIGTVSDEDGNYHLGNLCEGTYTVICSHVGCEPVKVTLEIRGNTVHDFYPEHHAEMLRGIEVVENATRPEPVQHIETLGEKQLRETRSKPLAEGLSKLSGVTTLNTGSSISKPVIHGLHSNRVLVMNNGIRMEGQQWGSEHAPEIDPFIAGKLSVVKGANSVRYGPDAIAGVILVEPKPLKDTAGVDGEINFAGHSNGRQGVASAIVNGNFKKIPALSWRVQGTGKRGGNIRAPGYFLKNTGVKEYNFSWAAGYTRERYAIEVFYSQFNTDIGIFSASHIGNLDDLQKAFEAAEPLEKSGFSYQVARPWQHIEHELFKVEGSLKTGRNGKLSLVYARQYNKRFEYDKHIPLSDSLAGLDLPALQLEITTHTADMLWEHRLAKSVSGNIGVSGIFQDNTYEGRYFIPNFHKHGGGVFWIERWKPLRSTFEYEAGLRLDYAFQKVYLWQGNRVVSPEFTYVQPTGTVGVICRVGEKLLLKAHAGSAWRQPNVSELFSNGLHHGAAAVEVGDTGLVPETAYNGSVSGKYTGQRLSVEAEVYYSVINDFIYLRPTLPPTLTIRGAFPTFRYSQVDALLYGMDLALSYKFHKNLHLTSKASAVRATDRGSGEYLVQMPADRMEHTLEYYLPDRKIIKDAYVSLGVLSVNKQWRVPQNSDFVPAPDGYTLLNTSLGFSFYSGKNKIDCGLEVNNLLNTVYRSYLNRFRYYADEMGRNIGFRLTVPFTILTNK